MSESLAATMDRGVAPQSRAAWKYVLCVVASIALVLFLIELKYPYYFLQDDNRDLLLPYLAHNYRALQSGEIAQFNFHQSSGYPSMASGITMTLFPPGYLGTWLSTVLFGHYFAGIDIVVVLSLLAGSLGWLAFFRAAGFSWQASALAATACSLNSFLIYGGTSWLFVVTTEVFLSWMLYFSLSLARDAGWKNMAGLLSARLLLAYTGYVEYFVYAALFESIVFLTLVQPWKAVEGRRRWSLIERYLGSWILVALLSAPLLLPMWHASQISAFRRAQLKVGALLMLRMEPQDWFHGLWNPFSQSTPVDISSAQPFLGHIGYVSAALLLLSLYLLFRRKLPPDQIRYSRVLLALALFTLLWSMGDLAEVLHLIPIFNRFRWPFKLLLFTNVFLIGIAATGCDYLLGRARRHRTLLFGLLFAANLANFLVLYLATSPKPFRTHLESIPLQEPMREKLQDGKLFTIGFPPYAGRLSPSFGFDYATLWGLYHFAGYDPMIPRTNARAEMGIDYELSYRGKPEWLPLPRLRQWGVRWYVVGPELTSVYSPPSGFTVVQKDEDRTIYRDELAKPLVFGEDGRGLPYRISANSIRIDTSPVRGERVCVNFVWNSFFSAWSDGRPLPVGFNRFGQMELTVPSGTHSVLLRYSDPFLRLGEGIAALTLLAIAAGAFLRRARVPAHATFS